MMPSTSPFFDDFLGLAAHASRHVGGRVGARVLIHAAKLGDLDLNEPFVCQWQQDE